MNVVLGVSGSVACYRACDLARELMRMGHIVRTCLTDSAEKFLSPVLFEALTGQPCLTGTFEEPEVGRMAHIDWARQADLIVVAPATANLLNKLASGQADDMLSSLALAYDGPMVFCPAMNPTMYASPTTQASLRVLAERGAWIVEPTEGDVACGEQGQGKLASIPQIVAMVETVLTVSKSLIGKKVLITSGPTREPIDDVRFISNRSSGKMGAALARAALLMGAEVTVVTGPVSEPLPLKASVIRVTTALEMLDACQSSAIDADFVIGAAAVADFRIANRAQGKIRRQDGVPHLALEPNPDVIAEIAKLVKVGAKVIAFAAEPSSSLDEAREKMIRKGVDAIAVNDISDPSVGFESDSNEIVFLSKGGEVRSPRCGKLQCGLWLLEKICVLGK